MEPYITTAFVGLQHDDIRGAQRGYGDYNELVGNPNDSAAAATDLGAPADGVAVTVNEVSIDDDGDEDWYRLSAGSGKQIEVTVHPVGFVYEDGDQTSSGCPTLNPSTDSAAIHDLAFQIVDGDGTTPIATVDLTGAGADETVVYELGDAGDKYIRVTGSDADDVQLYDLTVAVDDLGVVVHPRLALYPEEMNAILTGGNQAAKTLTIANPGNAALEWTLAEESLTTTALRAPQATVNLELDSGAPTSALNAVSVFNRFTPDPALFPFDLTEVHVYHPNWSNVNLGDSFDIYVYVDTDGDGDIHDAVHVASLTGQSVAALDTFSTYTLGAPVTLDGPGDVVVGMVYRENAVNKYPSAFDGSVALSGRAFYASDTGATADPPNLATATLQEYGSGSPWLIRGAGVKDVVCETPAGVSWLSLSASSGTTTAGGDTAVQVTFDAGGLATGTYNSNLCLDSNYLGEPQVQIPVALTVSNSCPTSVLNSFDVALDGANAVATWAASGADTYELWWSSDFYFTPGNDCLAANNCYLVSSPYTHPDVLYAEMAFELRAGNSCGNSTYAWSGAGGQPRPGLFHYDIVPGS
jgi:hypothetical protein